jgi:precorrin-8X/cobalt-precorrin-8 methylmutase
MTTLDQPPAVPAVHPIEAESYRIIASRVDLSRWDPATAAVATRVIHASADTGYADTLRFSDGVVAAGVAAVRAGAPVIADVEMVAAATHRLGTRSFLTEGRIEQAAARADEPDLTASAAAMRVAARLHPEGAVVLIGCAPTALFEVLDLCARGRFAPALVIGMPVGFVGAAESKQALRDAPVRSISNVGERGGSAVTAAAMNALARLAAGAP